MDESEVKYAAVRAAQIEGWHPERTRDRIARELDIMDVEARRICDWIFKPLKFRWDKITGDEVRDFLQREDLRVVDVADMLDMHPATLRSWVHNKHLPNYLNHEKMRQLMDSYKEPKKVGKE